MFTRGIWSLGCSGSIAPNYCLGSSSEVPISSHTQTAEPSLGSLDTRIQRFARKTRSSSLDAVEQRQIGAAACPHTCLCYIENHSVSQADPFVHGAEIVEWPSLCLHRALNNVCCGARRGGGGSCSPAPVWIHTRPFIEAVGAGGGRQLHRAETGTRDFTCRARLCCSLPLARLWMMLDTHTRFYAPCALPGLRGWSCGRPFLLDIR